MGGVRAGSMTGKVPGVRKAARWRALIRRSMRLINRLAWRFRENVLYCGSEWRGRFPRRALPYSMNWTRNFTSQVVRVFFIVREMLMGNNHITFLSVWAARLLPQPGEPILPGRAAGPALLI